MPYNDPFRHEHLFDLGLPSNPPVNPRSTLSQRQPQPYNTGSNTFAPYMGTPYPHYYPPQFDSFSTPPQLAQPAHQASFETKSHNTPSVATKWFDNAGARRVNTEIHIYQALKEAYAGFPDVQVIDTEPNNANIYAYVRATGDGQVEGLREGEKIASLFGQYRDQEVQADGDSAGVGVGIARTGLPTSAPVPAPAPIPVNFNSSNVADSMNMISYVAPPRRLDGGTGFLVADALFDRFLVKWHDHEFEIFIVDVRDGAMGWIEKRQYIVTTDPFAALALLKKAGSWGNELHGEIWVYDVYWQKDPALFEAIQKSKWEDIILPEELKGDLLKTVLRFYDSRETYAKLRVPWKRGLIFYGPPGNGKTVSIKATMKTLLDREESIPTLYVKSLKTFGGPEFAINQIFGKARQQAPCYLVFEDLDSLVNDEVRSFFLNAVDGLSENEGILMVGSTNHLERLDPGIAKRPSRFDRKYLFPDPALEERKRYCQLWQKKLKDSHEVKFPDRLVQPIARLMDGFSFAYMQEAFVSTLLKIANDEENSENREDENWDLVDKLKELEVAVDDKGADDDDDNELNKYVLWREIKVQVANLKKEVDRGDD